MKRINKKGGATAIVLVLVAVLFIGMFGFISYQQGWFAKAQPQSIIVNTGASGTGGQQGTIGQNPVVSLVFTNALTKQSITATAKNFKDSVTGALLGTSLTAFSAGQKVIPIINASGYLTAVQPEYSVIAGNQQLQGTLYQFQNATVAIYNNAGTGTIAGTVANTTSDSAFTTQSNNKIVITGNTYKSSGKLFIVAEFSTTTNVSSMALTEKGSVNPVTAVTVPNCYVNTLTSPFRQAWELPAVVGGVQQEYNLQTVSQNGNNDAGTFYVTVYNEKDGIDTLTGDYLTSGICDSNNAFFNQDKSIYTMSFA